MGDRYIYYNIGDRQFKVSESEREEFEKLAPEAKMNLTYNGKNHYVSLSELGDFVNTIGSTDGITYSSFDDNKNYSASSSTSPFSYSYEPEQETPAPAEEEESGWKRFWRKAGEAVTRAQVDSLGMPYEEEKKPIEHVNVDSDFADAAINSHEEHKKQIDKEINKIDEEYYAKKANEPEKSFWRKLLELPLTAQQNEMIGDDAFSLEMKSENREKGKDYTDALIAKNISEKVGKKVDQFQDPAKTFVGGVFQGLGDAVFDMDTWDQSIGLEQAARVMQITQKLEKGQALTKGEQMIIDALVDDLATEALAATFGRGYKAGKVTGESLPFMLETALNPASGLGEAITKKFGKKILGSVFGKAGLYATRLLSDVAGAGIMSATTSAPRVAADAMNRLSGNVDFTIDDEGALQFNGFVDGEDSEWKAFRKAFGSDMIGHFSEMVGNYFGPLGHRAGRWTKKQVAKAADAFGWKNIAKNIRTATPNGFGTMLNDFLEQTQWNGVIGEFSEEMIGGVLDALIVGDQSLNPEDENYLFDKDNLIDTLLGVSIMGGAISGAKTLGYTTPEARYNKAISEAQKGLEGHVSAEEMKMLEAFTNNPFGADYANLRPFFAEGKSEEDKKAVGKYISAIMQKQGYDISRNAQISGTKQGLEEMKSAYKLGQNMTEADIYDVNEAVNQAAAIVENDVIANYHFDVGLGSLDGETFISGEDLRNASSYDLFRIAESDKYGLSEETRNAFRTLALAKNTQEGLAEKLVSEANNAIKLHNQISIKASDKNGRLVKGMLGGNIVYVKGDVKTENGAIVKPEGVSSYPVEIIDSMTGETKTVNSNEINGIEALNVNEYNMDMANTIYEGFNNRWTEWSEKMSVKAKLNQVQQMVGSHIYINNGKSDLVEVEVQQILPNGEVLLKGKKGDLGGQSTIRVDVDSLYDSITRDEEGNVIFAKQSEFRSQTENIKNANPDRSNYEKKAGTASQQTAQPVTPETTTTEEVQPEPVVETAPVVDETEPEIEDFNEMEVDILMNGVPVKVEVTNQDDVSGRITYRYTDANGDVKIGGSTIDAFRKAFNDAKNYEKPEPASQVDTETTATEVTPTVDTVEEVTSETPVTEPVEATENVTLEPEDINWDALFESDKDAFLAELQNQWGDEAVDFLNEEIEVAQKEIEELSNAKTSGMSERSANRKKKKSLQERIDILNGMVASIHAEDENKTTVASQPIMPEPVVVHMQKDPEPMNAVQFAARELGLRNGGIKLQVDSFKHHTGYGSEEVKKFFGLFRSANKGGLTLEEAGERLMELDRENYTGFFDQNNPNAGIDAILEALSLNRTMGELRTFAAREQQAQAQNEADAAYSAMMAEYEARLGESVAETVEMEEDSDAVIWQNSLTDEDYEEFLAIFTDEKNEHGTDTNERETSAVSGDEKAGNIQPSDRGAEENSEASNTILQAEQPIYTRGEEVSTGESSALGSEVGEQNVVPSVSPRKQQEIEGTLDEDMPDFTTEVKKTPVAPNPVPNPIAAAKDREAKLLELLNRNAVSDELKADAAKRAGKEVADMFATREAYEAYEADAADLGAFVEIFDEGVEESFATRNNQNSSNDGLLFRSSSATTNAESQSIDDELKAIKEKAIADGTFMKAPNGKPTKLNEKQWLKVRTKSFKKWFGDWEIANLLNLAEKAWNDKDIKDKVIVSLSEKAKSRFDEILGTDVKQFIITSDAVRHIKNKHGQNEEKRGQKNMSPEDIAIIPYLINNFDSMNLNPSENDKLGRAIEVRKRINGVSVIGTIERGENKEFLVTNFTFVKSDALDASSETPGLNVRNDSDITKVKKDIENIKEEAINSSKVVDEHGEPLVVYHGTGNEFYTFRNTSEDNELGSGFYFTDSYNTAERYAKDENLADNQSRIQSRADDIFFDIMGHSQEDLYDNEYVGDYNLAYEQAVYELFSNSHVKGVFLNIRKPYVVSEDKSGVSIYNGAAIAHHNNDGIIDDKFSERHDTLSGVQYVAFSPNQIKSATDNVGTFDAENPDIRYRKADAQNAAVDYLVGEARNAAIENAVNEEASKLGVKVTYKTREQMPEGHENDKGYYNTKTGEIVVCTENASSIADAIQTILHESVAHKGLRHLMGDKFNEFINRVYNSLDADTKAKVDALATEHYDGNTAVATEEYMATLAESENFADNSVLDKIKSIFEDIINAILGRNDIKIGDNELRYILRASYNNMVNPRGMDTIRGWAQDQMMREEYKINQAETPEILSRTGVDPTDVAKETAKTVYDRVVNSSWNEFQRQFQDAYQPVRVAIDAIQAETGNIPIEDYENYLLIQNQSSSRSRVEIDNFERKYYTPIIEQVNAIIDRMLEARGANKNDKNERAAAYAELRQYLIAKHGLERNEYYQNNKTRKLTYNEKQKAIKEATDEYNAIVDSINSDTSLSDAEIESQLQEAKDAYDAALIEIETREVPDIRDYSGLTSLFGFEPKKFREAEEMAQKVVDTFEGSVDTSELWKKINAATDKTLRHSYESGLLSRQQYSDIKSMFKFYIPLRGFDETTAEDVYSYARFEGNRFNPAVQTAKGRTSVADDPIAIIMNMAESEIAQGNKNRAKQALYNYLLNRAQGKEHQNSLMRVEDVWYVISTDEFGNTISSIAAPDHEHGETYEEFEDRMQALAEENLAAKSKKGGVDLGVRFQKQGNRNAHYVYLKVNGVEKAIYINGDPKAAEAINGSNRPEQTDAQKVMRDINRVVSSTFTNYSLEFTVRNYFRDMLYSHINMSIRESDPAYRVQFRKNWRNNNLGTMMKLLNAYRSGELDGVALSDTEAAFVEFMNNGGQTGYTLINSVETHKKDLEKAIKRMQSGAANGGVKNSTIFKYTLGGIELLNEATELVTRFAAFKTSRDLGRGVNTSINDAKEITVNFNTKGAQDGKGAFGSIAKYFGWSKYFFNASVQGVQNIKAMAQANKLKFCTVVGGIAGLGFMMPIITAAIANIFSGDDDDDDNAYWNIPEYDRQNNLCIPVGSKYVKLPLPIGFREIYAIGDMVASMMFDKKFTRDVSSVGMDMANKIASVVLPINPLESSANGLNIWHTFLYTALPSTVQFLVQNATNIDWKGAPLQREYTYNEDDPQWMKAFAGNPDWMVCLSKWCNENINLDGDFEGMDWSPEKLDNTLSNLGGGIYTLIKKIGKTISMTWNEEERNLQNAPVVGVAIGSGIDSDDNFVNGSYFDMKYYYDANVNRIKRVAKSFGYEEEDVFIKNKGQHHPKMAEIYSNKNFEFMKEWYKGNKKLEDKKNEIKKLEKEIASKKNPSEGRLRKLDRLNGEFETMRSEFVNKMLELE